MSELRFTERREVEEIFLAGLIATGRISKGVAVVMRIDNLTAYAFASDPPTLVVEFRATMARGAEHGVT